MDNFSKDLITKYPTLFPKDENGQPKEPVCDIFCPPGWQKIVDALCHSITQYTLHTKRSIPNPAAKWERMRYRFVLNTFKKLIYKLFDPYSEYYTGDKSAWLITPAIKDRLNDSYKMRLRKWVDRVIYPQKTPFYLLAPICSDVTIVQIKEKFGALRVYFDGGDECVQGMVFLAEDMSTRTCEISGDVGFMHKKNMWYKTLSPEQAHKLGYKRTNELS